MIRVTFLATLLICAVQPTFACSAVIPMTKHDLAGADVAFIGIVSAVTTTNPQILRKWPRHFCNSKELRAYSACVAVSAVVFTVEWPLHGVLRGATYVVPQGSGQGDCLTHYVLGRRYVFGSVGINGKVWIVRPGVTAAEVMTYWAGGAPSDEAERLLESP